MTGISCCFFLLLAMVFCSHEFILMVSGEYFAKIVKYVGCKEISTSVDSATDKRPGLFHIV